MDKPLTPSERILQALADDERSKSWLARSTQIPLTTLDRKLRGDGTDFTLAQVDAITSALGMSAADLIPTVEAATDKAAS